MSRGMLRRLDTAVRRLGDLDSDVQVAYTRPTEEQLADSYDRWYAEGGAAGETDFPRAIEALRDAVAIARSSSDPPFDPPPDWRMRTDRTLAALDWRAVRFPAICEAIEWLHEMKYRSSEGTPPVTESEFRNLAAWFLAHRDRLTGIQAAGGTDFLDLGGNIRSPVWSVAYGVRQGARAEGAGKTAVLIRRMMTAYPGDEHVEHSQPDSQH